MKGAKRLINFPVTGPSKALAHTASSLGLVTNTGGNWRSDSWNHLLSQYSLANLLPSLRKAHSPIPIPN